MKIVIAAAGSRGDIAPYTGLGVGLSAAGHAVAIATQDEFAPMVHAAGLAHRPLPADRRPGPGAGPVPGRRELMRTAARFAAQLARGLPDAVGQGTDLLLLSATTTPLGPHLTEATGIPALGVHLQPNAPTRAFPPAVTGVRSLGGPANRALGAFALRTVDRIYAPAVRDLRERLGLPRATGAQARRRSEAAGRPVLHGFSTALVPRPADWRPELEIVGTWWPHVAEPRLPYTVEEFLASGPRPVLVTFGSMAAGQGERLSELVVAALRRAGLRGILQSGAASLAARADGILTVGDLPHELLMPRVAAVVHHAGAGTAAAARAGAPSVPVPVTADQPFWARRLALAGAATEPIPLRQLTVERLAHALRETPGLPGPRAIADRMASEDGVGAVVKAVERLPL
ncbi:glycosyltransferase [Streptomyces beihaiensis]|uniref:Glycosyltransferase n=1 Tax=Streptomyces beihaiensis TaxID=2984495 RepID=A0ABT3U1E4_9ACTN|nr:glycosyltransferase [Streptomyces beihaiensis]MCX3063089.1 glycosyltransferase [Streptomyces beihaiensis]